MATLESIEAKIAKLQAQAEAITKKQSAGVIAQIQSLMAEHGITMEDLGSAYSGKKGSKMAMRPASAKRASNAKYRDPKSGATWSGHGRAPGWIAEAKNRDKFLIDESSSHATVDGKKPAKPGNYIRGKQPAMYRDPKTGKEWSGRGMAPGWLASARDRTKFLIDGAVADVLDGKQNAPKFVAAKKTGAKKTGAKKTTASVSAKKGTAKKASTTSAKTSAGKSAAAKKSTSTAKKGPQVGSKKTAAKSAVAKKAVRAATAEKAADSTPLPPATSTSEVDAVP